MLKVKNKHTKQDVKSAEIQQIKQHHWRSFSIFIVYFEWILTPSSLFISIVTFKFIFVYWANP